MESKVLKYTNLLTPIKMQTLNFEGECYTAYECSGRGGIYSSTCGHGVGVCCFIVQISGGPDNKVLHNNTYVRSPGFPSTTAETATYTHSIKPISSSICQIRFDFETFVLEGPTTTGTPLGDCLIDTMTIREVSEGSLPLNKLFFSGFWQKSGIHLQSSNIMWNRNRSAPLHWCSPLQRGDTGCQPHTHTGGQLQWQEMEHPSDSGYWASWLLNSILILLMDPWQIECGMSWTAPSQCKEYHTGIAGTVKSWNFDDSNNIHGNDQAYSICIRREKGYCGYSVVPADEPLRLLEV